jgi:hypothetical protein
MGPAVARTGEALQSNATIVPALLSEADLAMQK